DQRNDAQKAELAKYYRSIDPELAKLNRELAQTLVVLDAQQDFERRTAEHQKRVAALAESEKKLPERQTAWEKVAREVPAWTPVEPEKMSSTGNATFTKQADGSILVGGPNATPEKYNITFTTKLTGITGVRLEVLPDPGLPAQGPGRAGNGNFVLSQ